MLLQLSLERPNVTDVQTVEVNITVEGEHDSLWIFGMARLMNNKEKQVYAFGVFNPVFSLIKMQVSSNTSSGPRSLSDAIKRIGVPVNSLCEIHHNVSLTRLLCLNFRGSRHSILERLLDGTILPHHYGGVILDSIDDMMFCPYWLPHHCAAQVINGPFTARCICHF